MARSLAVPADARAAAAVPLEMRVVTLLPLPPFAMALLIALALIALYVAIQWLADYPLWDLAAEGIPIRRQARPAFVVILLFAYALGAVRFAQVGTLRNLEETGVEESRLEPLRRAVRRHETPLPELRASRYAGVTGVVLIQTLIVVISLTTFEPESGRLLDSDFAWDLVMFCLLGWVLGRAAYFTVRGVDDIESLSASIRVDLLDLRPFHAFGRIALRTSLIWLVGVSFGTLLFLTPGIAPVMAPVFGLSLVGALLALLLPVRGLRHRIREAKRRELRVVEEQVRRVRDALLRGEAPAPGQLSDLLAYRATVEGVREWPFDTSTLVRFSLYSLIPLGSWLGGALVERLVNTFLD